MNSTKRLSGLIGLMAVLALALSGCVHADRAVTLHGDGSGVYTLTVGFSEQLVSLAGDQLSASMDTYGAKVKQAGGSYRHYDDTGYSYWAYTRPFKSVAQLNQLVQENPNLGSGAGSAAGSATSTQDTLTFSEQAGLLSNTFHVTGHISLKNLAGTTDTGGIDISSYLKDIRESFSVTMPGAISAHTGGVVNGDTVTYTIHYGEETDIAVTGSALNTALLAPLGIGVIVVLALVVAGAVVMRRRKRPPTPEPVAVGAPVGQGAAFDYPTVPSASQPTEPGGSTEGDGPRSE